MSEVMMAVDGDTFTAMQTQCMQSIRTEFDNAKESVTAQMQIIEKAKSMNLPAMFIQELRNDL